jgi:predicted RNase H-like nuclease (RuvC/YqgF family)
MMSSFYNYDTRGASTASQIINLERMVEERDTEIERLTEELKACRLVNRAIIEQLRTELAKWQHAADEGHPQPCTLGANCPYCEIERLRDKLVRVITIVEWHRNDYNTTQIDPILAAIKKEVGNE